jgi:hypothetical protein
MAAASIATSRARIDLIFGMFLPMPDGSLLKACWKVRRDEALRPGDEPGPPGQAY